MATAREFGLRLNRLRNTRKVTWTMKLVSANKLRKLQESQRTLDAFSQRLKRLLKYRSGTAVLEDPRFQARNPVKRRLVVVFSGDRGLCGGFNQGLGRHVMHWVGEHGGAEPCRIHCLGRRGHLFLRDRAPVSVVYGSLSMRPTYSDAVRISQDLQKRFKAAEVDEVWMAWNRLRGALSQEPLMERFLPQDPESLPPSAPVSRWTLIEPGLDRLSDLLITRALHVRVYAAMLENASGEQSARVLAMDTASRNVDDLVDRCIMDRNRARQAAITRELTEIMSGAEALKG
ncbi:MAG: ATP synthase F1 subunit gamma [Lentisphaerae bacterium RIFOXYC12_FULL_60_16]|nr:MAG: ATP synthase F1 subunit gamma [Lentisphaerae bacterium RIFOXYC12_FULL_60_16]